MFGTPTVPVPPSSSTTSGRVPSRVRLFLYLSGIPVPSLFFLSICFLLTSVPWSLFPIFHLVTFGFSQLDPPKNFLLPYFIPTHPSSFRVSSSFVQTRRSRPRYRTSSTCSVVPSLSPLRTRHQTPPRTTRPRGSETGMVQRK